MIRRARLQRGMTQVQLARSLGLRGAGYIYNLEEGLTKGVSVRRIEEIAAIFDLPPEERDRLLAAAGHLPARLLNALTRNPERWDDVLEMLAQKPRRRARR